MKFRTLQTNNIVSLKDKKTSYKFVKKGIFTHFNTASEKIKGSLSTEASLIVPIFVFFIVTLISILIMIKNQSENMGKLYEQALMSYESSIFSDDDYLEIESSYELYPIISIFKISIPIEDTLLIHAFNGYSGPRDKAINIEEDEYVYITKTGIKYHVEENCTYLSIRPRMVDAYSIDDYRNSSGRKYYACKICKPKKSGALFITNDGECYHCDSDCSALKRTVYMVTLKEAVKSGYSKCSKCG